MDRRLLITIKYYLGQLVLWWGTESEKGREGEREREKGREGGNNTGGTVFSWFCPMGLEIKPKTLYTLDKSCTGGGLPPPQL